MSIFSKLSTNEIKALADDLTKSPSAPIKSSFVRAAKETPCTYSNPARWKSSTEETLDDNKQPRLLCKLGPQSYFGELGLIHSDRRAATVRVPNRATAFIITRRTFEQHLGKLTNILKRNAEEMYIKKGIAAHKRPVTAKLEDLKTVGVLGVGSFGRVTLVSHGGETYALKEIGKAQMRRRLVDHVWREKETMKECDSPFLVNLRQTYVSDASIFMLMDKVLGGELFTYVHSRRSPLFLIARQILRGVRRVGVRVLARSPNNLPRLETGERAHILQRVRQGGGLFVREETRQGFEDRSLCTPQYLGLNKSSKPVTIEPSIGGPSASSSTNSSTDVHPSIKATTIICTTPSTTSSFTSPRKTARLSAPVVLAFRHMPAGRLGMGKFGVRDVKRHEWFATDINWPALANQRARAHVVANGLPAHPRLTRDTSLDTGDDVPGHSTKWGPYASVGRFKDF